MDDDTKKRFAKLLLDQIRAGLLGGEANRFLPEIRKSMTPDRRIFLPMRDPVLEAEEVYEDILDAEFIEGEIPDRSDQGIATEFRLSRGYMLECGTCRKAFNRGVWWNYQHYCSLECAEKSID